MREVELLYFMVVITLFLVCSLFSAVFCSSGLGNFFLFFFFFLLFVNIPLVSSVHVCV